MPDGFCVGVSCQECPFCDDPIKGGCKVARFIDAIPAADVVEVRHGRWCVTDAYPHNVYCSQCYKIFAQEHWEIWQDGSLPRDYCPSCGAKMDGGTDE